MYQIVNFFPGQHFRAQNQSFRDMVLFLLQYILVLFFFAWRDLSLNFTIVLLLRAELPLNEYRMQCSRLQDVPVKAQLVLK